MTIFSKCHHGLSYHPTDVGKMHPHLGFDLMRAQLDALHKRDILAPIYLSAGWDELAAREHPGWRVVTPEGVLIRQSAEPMGAGWAFLDFASPYLDYLCRQVEEVIPPRPARRAEIFLAFGNRVATDGPIMPISRWYLLTPLRFSRGMDD